MLELGKGPLKFLPVCHLAAAIGTHDTDLANTLATRQVTEQIEAGGVSPL